MRSVERRAMFSHRTEGFILLAREHGREHIQAGDDVCQRRTQVVVDHGGQVFAQGVQFLALADVAQQPLQDSVSSNSTLRMFTWMGM